MQINKFLNEEDSEYIINVRRKAHQVPELKFDLPKTTALIKNELKSIGVEYTEKYGKGSVVAQINKNKNKCIAIRADIDALPIEEKTGLEFSSKHNGIMHACGHDAHLAILLGTIRCLKRIENQLNCSVRFIFQPCEEGPEEGSVVLIDNGVLKDVDCIIALHVDNEIESGKIGVCKGPYMAGAHSYEIEFFGHSAHATLPETGSDALAMAVKAYQGMYLAKERLTNPMDKMLLSIGSLQAGKTQNVVSDYSKMLASVRYFDEKKDREFEKVIKLICNNAAVEMGGNCKIHDNHKGCVVVNDESLCDVVIKIGEQLIGRDNVIDLEARLLSEDFANYTKYVKGVLFRLGSLNEKKGCVGNLHNSNMILDEESFVLGAEIFVQFVYEIMNEKN